MIMKLFDHAAGSVAGNIHLKPRAWAVAVAESTLRRMTGMAFPEIALAVYYVTELTSPSNLVVRNRRLSIVQGLA